jgi:hypothetical protein
VTNADYYRGLAEDCVFAARQSSAKEYASGEGHRGGGRAHANGLAQNARSGQLVYDQGIRQLQRLAAAGANSKAGDR